MAIKVSFDWRKINMKEYEFLVSLCGGWCDGTITVKADDYETAYENNGYTVYEPLEP